MFSKKPVIFFFLLPQLTQRWDSWLDSSAQIWLINLLRAMKIQATVTLVLCFVFFSLCLFFVLLTSQTSITAPTFLSAEAFFLLRKSIDFKCCWSRSSPSFSPTESSMNDLNTKAGRNHSILAVSWNRRRSARSVLVLWIPAAFHS